MHKICVRNFLVDTISIGSTIPKKPQEDFIPLFYHYATAYSEGAKAAPKISRTLKIRSI